MNTWLQFLVRCLARVRYGSASTGAAVAITSHSCIVLVLKPGGVWALPGGFKSRRETPIDAASREVREETSMSAAIDVDSFRMLIDHRWNHVHFLYRASGSRQQQPAPHRSKWLLGRIAQRLDCTEARWFDLNELPELADGVTAQLSSLGLLSGSEVDPVRFTAWRSVS